MGIRLDGTTDTISAPGSDLNLGQSRDSVKVASEIQLPTHGALSHRNILKNGAMQIAQRATQVTSVTSTGYRTCDRWRINISSLGTWTIDQSTDAPPGFFKSLKVTCTTAKASPGGGNNMIVQQRLEGHDLQSLAWGTSSAKEFTISFYVKSSKAGNASFAVLNNDNSNIMVSFQYTISSANTWEYKTITVPAYTAGAFSDDNARSMQLEWWLNSGDTYTGAGTHQTEWAALSQTERNASNLGIGGAVNDTWQLAGVQMEVGSKATPFEHRGYADELARCQRYCYAAVADGSVDNYAPLANGRFYNSNDAQFNIFFPVTMRTAPTLDSSTTAAGTFFYNTGGGFGGVEATTIALNERSFNSATVYAQGASGQTAGNGTTLYSHDSEVAKLIFTAEL